MKIAILGSRDISVKILEWIIKQNNCEIVGVVAPTYKTWWNDKLKETAIKWGINTFDDINDEIITVAKEINNPIEIDNEHIVKVEFNSEMIAKDFFRKSKNKNEKTQK